MRGVTRFTSRRVAAVYDHRSATGAIVPRRGGPIRGLLFWRIMGVLREEHRRDGEPYSITQRLLDEENPDHAHTRTMDLPSDGGPSDPLDC